MPLLKTLEGRSLMSERPYPGTLPGKRRPFCSAKLRRERSTYSVDVKVSDCFGRVCVAMYTWCQPIVLQAFGQVLEPLVSNGV